MTRSIQSRMAGLSAHKQVELEGSLNIIHPQPGTIDDLVSFYVSGADTYSHHCIRLMHSLVNANDVDTICDGLVPGTPPLVREQLYSEIESTVYRDGYDMASKVGKRLRFSLC